MKSKSQSKRKDSVAEALKFFEVHQDTMNKVCDVVPNIKQMPKHLIEANQIISRIGKVAPPEVRVELKRLWEIVKSI